MLFFGRAKAFRRIEEGLVWRDGGTSQMPCREGRAPGGAFVEVPAFCDKDQLESYIASLAVESAHALNAVRPPWLHLRGPGVQVMPPGGLRDIVDAVCPGAVGVGMDLNPRLLGPGDIAGYRSAGVERFCFRMESPYDKVDDPVRRARALGAYAAVEVCFSDELNWLSFLHAVGRALESAPNQIGICDERRNNAKNDRMEAVADKIEKAGYHRLSLWAWAKAGAGFDRVGMALSGRGVGLGPGAFTCRPGAYRNPGFERWLATRPERNFEVVCADRALEQWLELASGMYAMDLKGQSMNFKSHRHAAALVRMGFLDKQGRPAAGWAMEFCHNAARLALRAIEGGETPAPASDGTRGTKGMDLWKTGSGGS